MRSAPTAPSRGQTGLRHALLWLAGADLRIPLLALPPLLPLIHRELHLNEKEIAALTGLPVLLLAAAAIPGSLLIARVGARRALIIGLLATVLGSALRGIGSSTAMLFAMTFLMGVGVAIAQPAIPTLINQWLERRHVGMATAIYTNGLLVGEALGAAFTLPIVLPLARGSWGWSLAWWALPVLASTLAIALLSPRTPAAARSARLGWMPDWRDPHTWQLGMVQGGGSTIYFGANAFIPGYLHAIGHAALVGPSLTALNVGQLPASLLVALAANRFIGRRGPLIAAGAITAAALVAFLSTPPVGMVLAAGVFGFCGSLVLILTLAMPPLVAPPDTVHRLSAGMFAISYAYAFAVPLLGGIVWDATGHAASAFIPVAIGALTVLVASSPRRLMPRG